MIREAVRRRRDRSLGVFFECAATFSLPCLDIKGAWRASAAVRVEAGGSLRWPPSNGQEKNRLETKVKSPCRAHSRSGAPHSPTCARLCHAGVALPARIPWLAPCWLCPFWTSLDSSHSACIFRRETGGCQLPTAKLTKIQKCNWRRSEVILIR